MPDIALDTGPLVALFDRHDRHHAAAVAFVRDTEARLVTNLAVITEVTHLLDFSRAAADGFLGWVGALEIDVGTVDDPPRITAIVRRPAGRLCRRVAGRLCERRGIFDIVTFDRDFDIYRIGGCKRFNRVISG